MPIIPARIAAVTFGDIRRDRHCRATNLRDEPKSLVGRQPAAHLIGLDDESDADLPDMKISVAAYHEREGIREGFRVKQCSQSA